MRVNVVYDRYQHHATRSGYPRLAQGLARHADVRRPAPGHPLLIPSRLTGWMAANAGMPQYGPRSAEFELVVAGRLAQGLPDICHFFYAEQNFRFAAAMSPKRVHVVPLGVDTSYYCPSSAARATGSSCGRAPARLRRAVRGGRTLS